MSDRIGIYGGTFSPVHNGHIAMAKSFIEQMELDRLYIIPTCLPPHKAAVGGASADDRMSMLMLAFGSMERVTISDIELCRGDKSYTVDTLRALEDEGELYLLCGSDMFTTFETWKEPQEIFRLASVVLGRREHDETVERELESSRQLYKKKYGARLYEIHFPTIEVSSSDIRERISRGVPFDGLVPREVASFIVENKLYSFES